VREINRVYEGYIDELSSVGRRKSSEYEETHRVLALD